MKHRLTFFALLMMAMVIPQSVKAYDFSCMLPNGIDLFFNIEGGRAVVTYPGQAANGCYWCGAFSPLGSITIPDSVTYGGVKYAVSAIGDYAFYGCHNITSVMLPSTVTSIGEHAFCMCDDMTSIVLPSSLTQIESGAFSGTGLLSIAIPNNVSYIGKSAFGDCNNLESVTFGNSIETIDSFAFAWCYNLHEIVLPNSLTTIRWGAFYLCGLTSVEFGNSITTIEDWAFAQCQLYDPVILPNSLTSIGDTAFLSARMLYYSGTASGVPWGALCVNGYIEDSMYYTSVAKDTLTGAKKEITVAVVPNSVEYMGRLAFEGCTSLYSVSLSSRLTYIGEGSFLGCTSLSTITIPDSVESIGLQAFDYCTSLRDVYLLGIEPPAEMSYAFAGPMSVTFHIPCGTQQAYSQALLYSLLDSIGFAMPPFDYQFSVVSDNETKGIVSIISAPSCADSAVIQATAMEGYRFAHWSNGITENPMSLMVLRDTVITAYFDELPAVPDTIYIHDTVYTTNYIYDTIYVTLTDTVTNTIHDTIDNFVYDTLTVIDTLWLTQIDTLWLRDTVIIHDTVYITQEGVDGVEAMNAKVYSSNGQIVVDGAADNIVWLYDVNGRVLATKQDEYMPLRFDAPASGTYLIKIGGHPARKVVVIR